MDIKQIRRAREAFFAADPASPDGRPEAQLRPEILASWRRTRQHGINPEIARPRPGPAPSGDGQLLRAARAVLAERTDVLDDTPCALTLTDQDGRLLERWVSHRAFAAQLDALGVHPGCDITEAAVGTSSTAIALEARRAVQVIGPEHAVQQAARMTTGSALVRHVASKKVLGTVGIVCGFVDEKPLLLSWVRETAAAIEREILASSSQRQRTLLASYLRANGDARHPVLCLDDDTVIGNATAVRLLNSLDQAAVWQMAADSVLTADRVDRVLLSSGGRQVRVDVSPIARAGRAVASEVRLTVLEQARRPARNVEPARGRRAPEPAPFAGTPGLVGRAPAWVQACERLASAWDGPAWVALVGEPGSGRTALVEATAAARGSALLRCTDLDTLNDAVRSGPDAVLVEGLDDLDAASRGRAAALVARLPHTTTVVMTTARDDSPATRLDVTGRPVTTVRLPPLRERTEDVPLLLAALTRAALGHDRGPRWLPETVQTLGRVRWSSNVSSLRAVVLEVLGQDPGPCVRVADLAPQLLVQAARRSLSPIEEVEALVVMRAMRDAEGNKKLAASRLGIARSTLYRKVRSLGLDLSVANY